MTEGGFLIVLNGFEAVREIRIDSGRMSFGRDISNDIVLNSKIVSKVHGYFEYIDNKLCVYDNNSTNGIYINDIFYGIDQNGETKIHEMQDNDIIRIDDESRSSDTGIIMLYTKHRSDGSWREYPMHNKTRVTIGRNRACDIHLENVRVSRKHALIEIQGSNAYITDNGSSNGIFINGERIEKRTLLNERDVIYIANSVLFYTKNILLYKIDVGGTRVVMRGINRTVKTNHGQKKILSNVNIQIEPNEFVAIIGGSGSGKTTVMNAMSGFERATSGKVFLNSVELYRNYKSLKSIIGYVPQQDIIYENITLSKMLEYSARMRISEDVSSGEIQKRINEVLDMVELTEHKDKLIKSLSGGQKKRASIAVELLGDPGLFFLDEPTSGLDPGTEESLMINLKNLSKQNNKTVIMVTHTTQNLHLCDKVLLMGKGGKVCFFGSVPECLKFFGTDSLTEIYNMVAEDKDVEKWSDLYYRRFGVKQHWSKNQEKKAVTIKREPFFKQLSILISRYMLLIKNDTQRLLMILLQPVLIGLLLSFVASDTVFEIYNSSKSILFALSCAGIWMGLFNSIQEICKERIILKREYMANLRLDAYVVSKFAVQLLISMIQAILITAVFVITVGKPESGVLFGSSVPELIVTMCLTIFSSAGIGLIVSSISRNTDKAMTVAPFLLIIQLLFSGILFELNDVTEKISYLTVSRWSVAALGVTSNLNELPSAGGIVRSFENVFEYTSGRLGSAWAVLGAFVIICGTASALLLRNVSKDSR